MNTCSQPAADDPFGDHLIEDMQWLGRLAARLVADPGLADDACQEAWMTASRAGVDPPSRQALAKGVRRFLLMHWRGSARRRAREHESAREDSLPAVDELLARREGQLRIWGELVQLADPHRRALLMRFQEGLSTRKIANALDLKQDTVRRHLREGVAMLRRRLEADKEGGGLAAIVAALPASMRRGVVAAEGTTRTGLGATSLKAGAAAAAIGACALALRSVLAAPGPAPVAPLQAQAPSPTAAQGDTGAGAHAPLAAPVTRVATGALDAYASVEAGSNPAPVEAEPTPAVNDPSALEVRVQLRTLDGWGLPERVDAVLEGLVGGSFAVEEIKSERVVVDGRFDIALAGGGPASLSQAPHARVTVTAEGFGTQATPPFPLDWKGVAPSTVELFLYPAQTWRLKVVHAESGAPIRGARLALRGKHQGIAELSRSDDDGLVSLPVIVTEATQARAADDHLFVQADGAAIGHWTLEEIEGLPLQRDGTRTLTLERASVVRGRVVLESGQPIAPGTAIAYSMERSLELTDFDFPHWMEPDRRVSVDGEGRFEIDGLSEGVLVLRPQTSKAYDAPALGPDQMFRVPASADLDLDIVVPAEVTVFTLHLEWLSPDQLLMVRLYEVDSSDAPYLASATPRRLLAKQNWVSVGRDVPLLLAKGALEEGRPYLLEVGPDFDNYLQRLIFFDGDAPRLVHSFAGAAARECPVAGHTPDERRRSSEVRALARSEGARVLLRARTE
ncbi:MAG: RNA polymerase sigma factor [Planctomycetota bacterium]